MGPQGTGHWASMVMPVVSDACVCCACGVRGVRGAVMSPAPGPDGVSRALDAVVFSPHKFVGGPSASGVLVVKRALIRSPVPTQPGAWSGAVQLYQSFVPEACCDGWQLHACAGACEAAGCCWSVLHTVVLAGGLQHRLWPQSRTTTPSHPCHPHPPPRSPCLRCPTRV